MIFLTTSTEFKISLLEASRGRKGIMFVHNTQKAIRAAIAAIRLSDSVDLSTVILDIPEEIEVRVLKHLLPDTLLSTVTKWKVSSPAGVYFAPETKKFNRTYRMFPRPANSDDTVIICGMAKRAMYMHAEISALTLDTLARK